MDLSTVFQLRPDKDSYAEAIKEANSSNDGKTIKLRIRNL